ncbi:hypothetical protein NQ318_002612, partial [Aromia moschata]
MTEIAMPPIISMSSDEVEDDVAFKVLNQDNLPITIVGEAILKPFGREHQKHKPNVIVHPTRRIVTNLEENKQKPFTKSNGCIENDARGLRKNFSNSHGNLNHNNSSKLKVEDLRGLDARFTKTLDAKLRRLQKEEKLSKKPQVDSTPRRPFVTTNHPPEVANLIGLKVEEPPPKKDQNLVRKLYAYASQPRVLNRPVPKSVHQSRCEAAARAAAKLIGSVAGFRNEEKDNTSVGK